MIQKENIFFREMFIVREYAALNFTSVLGAQNNRLVAPVLLSTYNLCFGCEIRKLFHEPAESEKKNISTLYRRCMGRISKNSKRHKESRWDL